jgi:hypothetical protein
LLLSCALGAHAQTSPEIAKAKAKAALALSHAQRMRDQKKSAHDPETAKAALLLATVQRQRIEREGCMTDLSSAIARSEREKKPLFLWVGMTCDRSIRDAFKTSVHCHVDELNGSSEPRLVVGPDKVTNWKLMKQELKPAVIPEIRKFLQPVPQKIGAAPMLSVQSC